MTRFGSAVRIVIIDDDDAVRESSRMILEFFGYEVWEYPSAEQYLSDEPVEAACLLLDQHMPGMTGLELLKLLRANGHSTPALIITARSDETLIDLAARLGARVVPKPVGEDDLIRLVDEARLSGA